MLLLLFFTLRTHRRKHSKEATLLKIVAAKSLLDGHGCARFSVKTKLRYLTTSTAPARTFGSLPRMETLAVNEPSILNTTASVLGGKTARLLSTHV